MNLSWIKYQDGRWCCFDNLDLSTVRAQGVYVIWHAGNPGRVVYVGQGDVAARILAHRQNTEITKYRKIGQLLVTWAAVHVADRDGVERYLADLWLPLPLVGDVHPDARPIAVNSPGW